jgi:hypothetical protein
VVVSIILIAKKSYKALLDVVIVVISAVALIATLFALNFGAVRFAVYRELGVAYTSSTPSEEMDEEAEKAMEQIVRSDEMRGSLSKASIEEIKKNPLIGTGKAYFAYTTSGGEDFNVPAHNFILTTINCYGAIGFGLILIMFVALLKQYGLFNFKKGKAFVNLLVWLVIIMFFGIGMVQASVYDILVMPTFCIAIGCLINERENAGLEK